MNNTDKPGPHSSLRSGRPNKDQKRLVKGLIEANKHAKKHNRLLAKQQQQTALNYELAERRYLIEKSALQPTFRLTATEFLTCLPDFVNDPEQASEAKFLADHGVPEDQRALRIKVDAKGGAAYMHPNIIIKQNANGRRQSEPGKAFEGNKDERIHAMNELTFFIDVASLDRDESGNTIFVYFVYQDRTTLPVVLKYRLTQRADSTLLRWDATHLDTVYANARHTSNSFVNHQQCEALFVP